MSYPRYPEYKDSGVEWLGQVPAHWTVTKLKFVARFFGGATPSREELAYWDGDLPWVSPKDMKVEFIRETEEAITSLGLENSAASLIPTGRVLMVVRSGILKHTIPVAINLVPVALNQDMKAIDLDAALCGSRFFMRWVQGLNDKLLLQWSKEGATVESLEHELIANTLVPLPPADEQEVINVFLQREVAELDDLITEQERLISLLQEKRQTAITHAVTKGLNPNAPMKDSGVEWLGQVPAHWEVCAIKWLSPVNRGASPRPIEDPKYFDDEGEYAWVRISDVSDSDGMLRETTQRLSDLGSSLSVKLAPGDLFVSIAGTVGKPCISAIKACIHDGFVYFPGLKIDPFFLFRVFEAGLCYGGLGKWGTQLNLNTDTIGSILVAVPPTAELSEILSHIEHEAARLDALTADAHRTIALLSERRTALLTAAVTGRIDVRGFAEREAA